MHILSLNPNPGFQEQQRWREQVTVITAVDSDWQSRSMLGKAIKLTRLAKNFDVVLFYSELRLAAIGGLLLRCFSPSCCLVFQEFIRNHEGEDHQSAGSRIRSALHEVVRRLVVRLMNVLIVHARAEVEFYSSLYNTSTSRFVFIPYFHYEDSCHLGTDSAPRAQAIPVVLAAGRHRDYRCFVRAIETCAWDVRIVAGAEDRDQIAEATPNLKVHYDLERQEYRRHIAESTVVVLPLFRERWQRSLGQITMLEAMAMKRPIVAARTFQLSDYASDDEVLFYEPGDAADLRRQISRLLGDTALQHRLIRNAWDRIHREFTVERYVSLLIEACQTAVDLRSKRQTTGRIRKIEFAPNQGN